MGCFPANVVVVVVVVVVTVVVPHGGLLAQVHVVHSVHLVQHQPYPVSGHGSHPVSGHGGHDWLGREDHSSSYY